MLAIKLERNMTSLFLLRMSNEPGSRVFWDSINIAAAGKNPISKYFATAKRDS
jgi:hypothetical protein